MKRPVGPPASLPATARPASTTRIRRLDVSPSGVRERSDRLVTEEPLEIRVRHRHTDIPIAVTMRTPGHDFELATGFLVAEGVVRHHDDVTSIAYCASRPVEQHYNVVTVDLAAEVTFDPASVVRNVYTTSSCGVCGKATLDAVRVKGMSEPADGPALDPEIVRTLPDRLRASQRIFEATGGLHAAGVFTPDGEALVVREDVGRHNAVDKAVGHLLMQGRVPATDTVLQVSGRASFEIVQKALAAGIAVVSAVSAPSSLAVDLAAEFGMTLVGFSRGESFNVYSGASRLGL